MCCILIHHNFKYWTGLTAPLHMSPMPSINRQSPRQPRYLTRQFPPPFLINHCRRQHSSFVHWHYLNLIHFTAQITYLSCMYHKVHTSTEKALNGCGKPDGADNIENLRSIIWKWMFYYTRHNRTNDTTSFDKDCAHIMQLNENFSSHFDYSFPVFQHPLQLLSPLLLTLVKASCHIIRPFDSVSTRLMKYVCYMGIWMTLNVVGKVWVCTQQWN